MMNREIKFRAWLEGIKKMDYFELADIYTEATLFTNPDNVELMQYTGLKDKNGKEIYEGDILEYIEGVFVIGDTYRTPVIFSNGMFRIDNNTVIDRLSMPSIPFLKDCEVIGNIYENPELLEGE